MKSRLMPKTLSGKWSVVLSILFIILIWLKMEYSIHVMTFAITVIGLAGFIISIIATVKNKDRSIISFLPVLVGLVILLWIAGEMLYPH